MKGLVPILSDILKSQKSPGASGIQSSGEGRVLQAKVLKLFSPAQGVLKAGDILPKHGIDSSSSALLLIQGRKVLADINPDVDIKKGDIISLKQTDQGKLTILSHNPRSGASPVPLDSPLPSNTDVPGRLKTDTVSMGSALKAENASMGTPLKREVPMSRALKGETVTMDTPLKAENISMGSALNYLLRSSPLQGFRQLADMLSNPVISKNLPVDPGDVESGERPGAEKTIMNSLRDLLYNVALKSEKLDPLLLHRLLENGGLLLEKKMSAFIEKVGGEINSYKSHAEQSSVKQMPNESGVQIRDEKIFSQPFRQTMKEDIFRQTMKEDMKAAVLQALSPGDDAREGEMDALGKFAQNLEKLQVLNSHLSDTGKYLLPFPLFYNGSFSFGQLFFDLGSRDEKKSDSENRILKVSLFLTMSALGPLRADFSVLKNHISGVFMVEDRDTADFVTKMLPDLTQRLQKHEYMVRTITCQVADSDVLREDVFINDICRQEDDGLRVII
ncbi:MAG: flagellar hook-length control protein FliK [Desulfamplus sp.]|nr:flagellar hook-length control protein FliK [Desulfamplus sp.]